MTAERFPVTPFAVELAQQLRRGMEPGDLDAAAEEIVAAYRLLTAALKRQGQFSADMAKVGFDLAEVMIDALEPPPARRERTIVVAESEERAQLYRSLEQLPLNQVVVVTTSGGRLPQGLKPLAKNVVLLDGWRDGRDAADVKRWLLRALAQRGQSFDDCRREAA